MYEQTSKCMDVKETRKDLFPAKNGQIEKVPPTQAALSPHLKRGIYQGSICWGQDLELDPTMPVHKTGVGENTCPGFGSHIELIWKKPV